VRLHRDLADTEIAADLLVEQAGRDRHDRSLAWRDESQVLSLCNSASRRQEVLTSNVSARRSALLMSRSSDSRTELSSS
jgi:hypothetical protein